MVEFIFPSQYGPKTVRTFSEDGLSLIKVCPSGDNDFGHQKPKVTERILSIVLNFGFYL